MWAVQLLAVTLCKHEVKAALKRGSLAKLDKKVQKNKAKQKI